MAENADRVYTEWFADLELARYEDREIQLRDDSDPEEWGPMIALDEEEVGQFIGQWPLDDGETIELSNASNVPNTTVTRDGEVVTFERDSDPLEVAVEKVPVITDRLLDANYPGGVDHDSIEECLETEMYLGRRANGSGPVGPDYEVRRQCECGRVLVESFTFEGVVSPDKDEYVREA